MGFSMFRKWSRQSQMFGRGILTGKITNHTIYITIYMMCESYMHGMHIVIYVYHTLRYTQVVNCIYYYEVNKIA